MRFVPSVAVVVSTTSSFVFFNDPAITDIYTLSLHDALPISTGTKDDLLPQNGPKMIEIYKGQMSNSLNANQPRALLPSRTIKTSSEDLVGYTRTAQTEINNQFPTLPNPTLVMYVYPHLAGKSNHPVPGYSTSFSFYESVQYALPGEVSQ